MEIHFDKKRSICCARINIYLLEKRNLVLTTSKNSTTVREGVVKLRVKDFGETTKSFTELDFSLDDIKSVFKVVALYFFWEQASCKPKRDDLFSLNKS